MRPWGWEHDRSISLGSEFIILSVSIWGAFSAHSCLVSVALLSTQGHIHWPIHRGVDLKGPLEKYQGSLPESFTPTGFPGGTSGKESTCHCKKGGFDPCPEEPMEEETAPHSSILAWRISWAEDPGGLQSTGSQRGTRPSRWARTQHAQFWNSGCALAYSWKLAEGSKTAEMEEI